MSTLGLILCLLFSHVEGAHVYAGKDVGVSWGFDANCEHGNNWELIGDPSIELGNTEC